MPADLIPQFAQLCLATKGRYERVALVTDVRGSLTFEGLFKALDSLDQMPPEIHHSFCGGRHRGHYQAL